MNKKYGFWHDGQLIVYLEPKGKDISFQRWRITGYYRPNFAITIFCQSETEYNQFLKSHINDCYDTYETIKCYVS
jgi:hypothetical protein